MEHLLSKGIVFWRVASRLSFIRLSKFKDTCCLYPNRILCAQTGCFRVARLFLRVRLWRKLLNNTISFPTNARQSYASCNSCIRGNLFTSFIRWLMEGYTCVVIACSISVSFVESSASFASILARFSFILSKYGTKEVVLFSTLAFMSERLEAMMYCTKRLMEKGSFLAG